MGRHAAAHPGHVEGCYACHLRSLGFMAPAGAVERQNVMDERQDGRIAGWHDRHRGYGVERQDAVITPPPIHAGALPKPPTIRERVP